MKIAVDFDGTLVDHRYPMIGDEVPGAFDWLTHWKNAGAQLILWTMRSGKELQEAVDFCKGRGITFDAINEGIGDREWTQSPKAYAHVYVDDAAFGCPLMRMPDISEHRGRLVVDWSKVGPVVGEGIRARVGGP